MSRGAETKTCKCCGSEFSRRTDIRWPESDAEWSARRYCGRRCGLRSAPHSNPKSIATDRPRLRGKLAGMHPFEVASHELLKRCISYGLRNNSDLGMGYQAFMDRARELGLAA